MSSGRETVVYMVDDDPNVLNALARLLHAAGYAVQAFLSPRDFLREHDPRSPGCVVLDIYTQEIDGLSLQQSLLVSGAERFIVFMSRHGDVAASVQAMKAGAVDVLAKPFPDEDLLAAVRRAIAKDRHARKKRSALQSIQSRMTTLTPREQEVMRHVVAGRLNKQIAAELGIAEKTIKVHRARVMEKMGVASLAELVRIIVQHEAGAIIKEWWARDIEPENDASASLRNDG